MAQIKAAQDNGSYTRCPRCGKDSMKPNLHTNALSRQYDIMVCDLCGMDEAKMAFMGAPKPLAHWACLDTRSHEDFKAVPCLQALKQIEKEQIPYLMELYRMWKAQTDGVDWEAWRLDAYESCPGLTTLWFKPFEARYSVSEGTVVIRFRLQNNSLQYVTDLLLD